MGHFNFIFAFLSRAHTHTHTQTPYIQFKNTLTMNETFMNSAVRVIQTTNNRKENIYQLGVCGQWVSDYHILTNKLVLPFIFPCAKGNGKIKSTNLITFQKLPTRLVSSHTHTYTQCARVYTNTHAMCIRQVK